MRCRSLLVICGLYVLLGGGSVQGQAPEGIAPGEVLPSVGETLHRMDGTTVSPRSLGGREGTVVLFWSNRCPWVEKYYGRVDTLASRYRDRGIQFVLVNANDAEAAPGESRSASRRRARDEGYDVPYVRDPDARLARTVGATRTPQVFVFGADWRLLYRGAIDDSPSLPRKVERTYLRDVLRALLAGESASYRSRPAFGCTLKYPHDSAP